MKVKLKNVRLSYPHLFTSAQFQGDERSSPRYGATFLVKKGSADDKAIRAAIKEIAVEKLKNKAEVTLRSWENSTQKMCYTDGDLKDGDQYEGMMVLAAHRGESQGAPVVVDRDPTIRLTEKDGKPYAGCYVNATVDLWVQTGTYTGIRATLIAVQFAADGAAFAGAPAVVADDDFEDLSDPDENSEDDDFFQEDPNA